MKTIFFKSFQFIRVLGVNALIIQKASLSSYKPSSPATEAFFPYEKETSDPFS